MRFCTPTQGEHGISYVVPTLMTLTNPFHPENPRSSIGAKVEISGFAVGELVIIECPFDLMEMHYGFSFYVLPRAGLAATWLTPQTSQGYCPVAQEEHESSQQNETHSGNGKGDQSVGELHVA